jgi:hypothetical protein
VEEHERQADQLEEQADRLEERSDRVKADIDDTRADFEGKLGDNQAPGLLDEEDAAPGGTGGAPENGEEADEDQS